MAVCLLGLSVLASADSLPTGTWVLRNPLPGGPIALTVEAAGSGRKLTYKFAEADKVMTLVTQHGSVTSPDQRPGHCSSVSLEPPSPIPVMPMLVSTVTTILL